MSCYVVVVCTPVFLTTWVFSFTYSTGKVLGGKLSIPFNLSYIKL